MLIPLSYHAGENKTGNIFISDKPKIHEGINGGILDVHLDFETMTGRYICPAGMFGNPNTGDFIDVTCASGRKVRCVVTSWTQDWSTCKGEVGILCYVDDYLNFIKPWQ